METQEKQLIKEAIAHLKGYALILEKTKGFKPLAVIKTIEKLNNILPIE